MNYKNCENVENEIFASMHNSNKYSIRIFINATSKIKRNIKYFFLKKCVKLDDQLKIVKNLIINARCNDIKN